MGTTNRQVIKPQSGVAVKANSLDQKRQYLDIPLDFSGNAGGGGANVPYYRIDLNQLSDSFGMIQGLKVDTRNMNTDLIIAVRGGALGQATLALPGDGVEMVTVEPGVIVTFPIEALQELFIDAFVTSSDPVNSAATYGSAVIYVTNFPVTPNRWPREASRGLIAPAGKAITFTASGTYPIINWNGAAPASRILHGARLVKPAALIAAAFGGVKVVISIVVTTPVTGAQTIPLLTLYNYAPTVAAASQIDSYSLGSGEGLYLPKYTTQINAVATVDSAATASAWEIELLLEDSSNDVAPLT